MFGFYYEILQGNLCRCVGSSTQIFRFDRPRCPDCYINRAVWKHGNMTGSSTSSPFFFIIQALPTLIALASLTVVQWSRGEGNQSMQETAHVLSMLSVLTCILSFISITLHNLPLSAAASGCHHFSTLLLVKVWFVAMEFVVCVAYLQSNYPQAYLCCFLLTLPFVIICLAFFGFASTSAPNRKLKSWAQCLSVQLFRDIISKYVHSMLLGFERLIRLDCCWLCER